MLALVLILAGITIALCVLFPVIIIPLVIVGVLFYGFIKGFISSLWESYQQQKQTNQT